ncbi:MAG: ribonuclease HII [Candidatus Jordarchaeum sp.]|uniref:ribonuclease HII n=1 Tax=Candidatus Jordarchaeum sp. TaxID=2823881 RepID=UPI00404B1B25
MLIAGVDEAGRGPILGPIVFAGVLIEEEHIPELTELGIRDSKLLQPSKREILAAEILKLASKVSIKVVSPEEIDEAKANSLNLNLLEAHCFADIINQLKPDVTYVDAADVNPERFSQRIKNNLTIDTKLISQHRADCEIPVVSAASIIAKVERDRRINELKKFGEVGSGYCHDPKTISFLKCWVRDHGELPSFVRRSWITAKRILDEIKQTILDEFSKENK